MLSTWHELDSFLPSMTRSVFTMILTLVAFKNIINTIQFIDVWGCDLDYALPLEKLILLHLLKEPGRHDN